MDTTAQLINIEEFIDKAKKAGYRFGKGNPKNRLRYLTKTGVLPHAVRFQAKETDAHTTGYYPESALRILLSAQKLKRQEKLSAEKIADRVEPIVRGVERGALPDSLVTTRERERLRFTPRLFLPALAGAAVFLLVLSQTVFGKVLGDRMMTGMRAALFPEEAIRQLVKEAEGGEGLEGKKGKVLAEEDLKGSDLPKDLILSVNLLKNSSFESAGSTAPAAFWQFHPNSTDGNTQRSSHTSHSGSYSLLITADTGGVIQEATKTEAGRNYTLGAWVKTNSEFRIPRPRLGSAEGGQNSELHLALGPGYDKSFGLDGTEGLEGSEGWQYYSTTFENPPPGLVPRVYIARQESPVQLQTGDSWFVFVDDAVMAETESLAGSQAFTNYLAAASSFQTLVPSGGNVLSVSADGILYPTDDSQTQGGLGTDANRFGKAWLTNVDLSENLSINGKLDLSGKLTANGNLTLGNNDGDEIEVGGRFTSDLVPKQSNAVSVGTSTNRWNNLFAAAANLSNNLTVGGTITVTGGITGNSGLTVTGDLSLDGDLDFTGPQNITTTSDNLTISPTGNLILDSSGGTLAIRDAAIDLTSQPTTVSANTLTLRSTGNFILDTSANNSQLRLATGTGAISVSSGALTAAVSQLTLTASSGPVSVWTSSTANGEILLRSAGSFRLDTSANNTNVQVATGTGDFNVNSGQLVVDGNGSVSIAPSNSQITITGNTDISSGLDVTGTTTLGDGGTTNYLSVSSTGDLNFLGSANNLIANNDLVIRSGNSLTLDTSASNNNLVINTGSGTLNASVGTFTLTTSAYTQTTNGAVNRTVEGTITDRIVGSNNYVLRVGNAASDSTADGNDIFLAAVGQIILKSASFSQTTSGNTETIVSAGDYTVLVQGNNDLYLRGGGGGRDNVTDGGDLQLAAQDSFWLDAGDATLTVSEDAARALTLSASRGGILLSSSSASGSGDIRLISAGTLTFDTSAKNSNLRIQTGSGTLSGSVGTATLSTENGALTLVSRTSPLSLITESTTNGPMYLSSTGTLTLDTSRTGAGIFLQGGLVRVGSGGTANNVSGSGALYIQGGLEVDGSVYLGDISTDDIVLTGQVGSNLIPNVGSTYNLGSTTNRWLEGFIDTLTVTTLNSSANNISGITGATFTIDTSNTSGDTQDISITFERGTPATNSQLLWDASEKYFSFNAALNISPDTDITTLAGEHAILNVNDSYRGRRIATFSEGGTPRAVIDSSGNILLYQSSNIETSAGTLTMRGYSGLTLTTSTATTGEIRVLSRGTLQLDTSTNNDNILVRTGTGQFDLISSRAAINAISLAATNGGVDISTSGVGGLGELRLRSGGSLKIDTSGNNNNILIDSGSGDLLANIGSGNLAAADDATAALIFRASAGGIQLSTQSADNGNLTLYSAGTLTLDTSRNNTNVLILPGSGNVGIGSTAPVYKLDVNGTLRTTSTARVEGALTVTTGGASVTGDLTLDGDLDFTGAQNITTTTDDLTLSPTGNLRIDTTGGVVKVSDTLRTGDGGTTDYLEVSTTGDVTLYGAANNLIANNDLVIRSGNSLTIDTSANNTNLVLQGGTGGLTGSFGTANLTAVNDSVSAVYLNSQRGGITLSSANASGSGPVRILSGGSLQLSTSQGNQPIYLQAGTGNVQVSSNQLYLTGNLVVTGTETFNGVAYTFPGGDGSASNVLTTSGTGLLSWGTLGAGSITADSLDFSEFKDEMTLDADTSINGDYSLIVRSGLGAIQNSTSGSNDLQLSAEDKLILGAASFDLLTSSGAVDIISNQRLDLSAGGTLTLDTSSNNSNILLKTGSGNINVSTGTLTMTGVLDVRDSTGTLGLVVDSTGNVGIGTTSPGGILDVLGQCVAKGTRIRLRRRRRRKKTSDGWGSEAGIDRRQASGVSGATASADRNELRNRNLPTPDGWEELDLPIEEVKTGDEVLTLDEQTGRFVWQKVEEVMDKGIQAVFELTTASGKKIETTGNHPYLARNRLGPPQEPERLPLVFIDETGIMEANGSPYMGVGALKFYGELSTINRELREVFLAAVNELGEEEKTFEFKFNYVKPTNIHFYRALIAILKRYQDQWEFTYKLSPRSITSFWKQYLFMLRQTLEKLSGGYTVLTDYLNQPGKTSKKIETAIAGLNQVKNILQIESQGSVFLQLADLLLGAVTYGMSRRKDEYRGELNRLVKEMLENKKWAGVSPAYAAPKAGKEFLLSTLGESVSVAGDVVKGGQWTKVSQLSAGMEIATIDGFERIAAIKQTGRQQVYDLAIEATHNFVGNGIVAHNTTSIAMRAGSATLEASNLGTSSTTADIQLYAADSMLASVGDLTLQVSEDSTYPLILRSAQGGIQLSTQSSDNGNLTLYSAGTLTLDSSRNNTNIQLSAGTGTLNVSAATARLTGNLIVTGTETFNGVTYTFPGADGSASNVLTTSGAGILSWGTLGASSITADSLDFSEFKDEMTLDADTTVNGDQSLVIRTGLGSIQNSTSGSNDLQLSAEDKLILGAASFDLLTSSGGIDMISGSYMDLSSKGTLTLDTSQNNSNILMKTGSGNINVSTGTLTMTGLLDIRDSTGTLALATDANGNIGIGTTGPGGILDVLGQCVTGDTLLKRRRRRKGRTLKGGAAGDGPEPKGLGRSDLYSFDDFEDVRIDEIESGDEILTLDEKTGKFVVQKVNRLMDKGIKAIIKLTTESGKTIKTTSEHPYLTQVQSEEKQSLKFAFVDETGIAANTDTQPYFGVGALTVTKHSGLNKKLHDVLVKATSAYKITKDKFEFKFNNINSTNLKFYKKIIKILKDHIDEWEFSALVEDKQGNNWTQAQLWENYLAKTRQLLPNQETVVIADYLSKPNLAKEDFDSLIGENVGGVMQIESQGSLLLQVADILLGAVSFTIKKSKRLVKKEIAGEILEILKAKKMRVTQVTCSPSKKQYTTTVAGLSRHKKDGYKVTLYRLDAVDISPAVPLVKEMRWAKVRNLKVGDRVATADGPASAGGFGAVKWERISGIEKLPAEQVYDIEVEATHNFVAGHYVDLITHQPITDKQEKILAAYLAAGDALGGKLGEENKGQQQRNQGQAKTDVYSGTKISQVNHNSSKISSTLTANDKLTIANIKDVVNTPTSLYASGRNKAVVAAFDNTDDRILNWLERIVTENDIDISLEEAIEVVKRYENGEIYFGGIVAHNTTSIALRAGQSTLEASNLGTSSTTADIQLYAADSLLASVGDLTLQASEDSTYPIILRSAQGGIQLSTQSSDNGNLTLYSAGTLTLDSSRNNTNIILSPGTGNVGIGSTSPAAKLTINGTTEQLRLSYDASNYQSFTVGSTGDLFIAQDGGAATLALTNGSVGIGTTSPLYTLDVSGGTRVIGDAGVILRAGRSSLNLSSGTTSTTADIQLAAADRIDLFASTFSLSTSSLSAGELKLQSKGSLILDTSATNAPIVMLGGNVGIGTTGPGAQLDIYNATTGTLRLSGGNTTSQIDAYSIGNNAISRIETQRQDDNTSGLLTFYTALSGTLTRQMTITNAGNVGIGTTSPGGILDVLGQCVTGDTLLKRRRRRKGRTLKGGAAGDGPEPKGLGRSDLYSFDDFEDVRIDEIEPGDEILTLDEQTGKFVWQKVNKLMNKGVKMTYELVTAGGKTIRTTANHPYLTLAEPENVNFLQKESFEWTEKTARKYYFTNLAGRRVYSPALKDTVHFTEEGWNHFADKSRSTNELISRFFALPRVAALLAKAKQKPVYEERLKPDMTVKYWVIDEIVENVAVRVVVCGIDDKPKFFLSCAWLGTKAERGIEANKKELSLARILTGRRRRMVTSQLSYRLNIPDGGRRVKWVKVANLKPGQKIATVNGWETIISIREMTREQVYDLEIAATHNFVANGIVAHNTTSIAMRAGAATLEASNLGTSSTTADIQLYAADSLLASVGDLTLQASEDSTYPLILRSAQGGIQLSTQSSDNGNLTLYSAGTLTLDSSRNNTNIILSPGTGNVGIGSTSPAAKLTINGTTEQLRLSYDASNYQSFTVGSTGDLFIAQDGGAATLALTNGSVGIGTTSPLYTLDVSGGTRVIGDAGVILRAGRSSLNLSSGTTSTTADLQLAAADRIDLFASSLSLQTSSTTAGDLKIISSGSLILDTSQGNNNIIFNTGTGGITQNLGTYTVNAATDQIGAIALNASRGGITLSTSSATSNGNLYLKSAGTLQLDTSAKNSAILLRPGTSGVGIGSETSPDNLLDVEGTMVGRALVSLNETGDQAILTASASGVPRFTVGRADITIAGQKDLITSGMTNVNDVFVYDTTKDADGGRWRADDRAKASSWYNEALDDGASDPCVNDTDDRCGRREFPEKAIIVATNTDLFIFDARDNSQWMNFDKGATTTEQMIGPTTNSTGVTASAGEGKIYYGNQGSSGGLYVIDFVRDQAYRYNSTDDYAGDKTVSNRNSTVTWTTGPGQPIVNNSVNDVSAAVVCGGGISDAGVNSESLATKGETFRGWEANKKALASEGSFASAEVPEEQLTSSLNNEFTITHRSALSSGKLGSRGRDLHPYPLSDNSTSPLHDLPRHTAPSNSILRWLSNLVKPEAAYAAAGPSCKTYVAVATDAGVSVINETDQKVINYTNTAGADAYSVQLTEDGTLYFSEAKNDELAVFTNIQTDTADQTAADRTYDESSAPALWASAPSITGSAGSLTVTQGTSTVDGNSNTIYLGHNDGMSRIDEKAGDATNGSVKYYTNARITEEMAGDIRLMLPLNGTLSTSTAANTTISNADASVKLNPMTTSGAEGQPAYATGVRGTGLTFDGVNDYVCSGTTGTCADDTDLDVTGNLTVGAWVKTSDDTGALISKYDQDVSADRAYRLIFSGSQAFFSINTTSLVQSNSAASVYNDNNWHFLTGVYDGVQTKLYADGVLIDSDSQSGNIQDSSIPLQLGRQTSTSSGTNMYLIGTIDEPFVTAEALTPGQIKHMYEVGKRALQNHTASRIVGVTGADNYQRLMGNASGGTSTTSNVMATAVDDSGQFIYAGLNDTSAATGGVTVIGANSDSAVDLFDATANTAKDDDAGTQFSASDVVAISVAGSPCPDYNVVTGKPQACNNQATLAIAGTNDTATRVWMETADLSLFSTLASVAGTSLYKAGDITAGSALKVMSAARLSLDTSTAEPEPLASFLVDQTGNLSVNSFSLDASGGTISIGQISATPAASDVVGALNFMGRTLGAAGQRDVAYGGIRGIISSATDQSEAGILSFLTMRAGTLTEAARFDNNGNLGIGTTSPGGILDVLGQCVARGTMIKRKRRRKYQKRPGLSGKGLAFTDNDFEDVPVEEIEAGDEVLTLDEQTGKFVVSKIQALMDKGIKQTYFLLTSGGKSIRTTANHPYLTRPSKSGSLIIGGTYQIDQSPRLETLTQDSYIAVANKQFQFVAKISKKDKLRLKRAYNRRNQSKYYGVDTFAKSIALLLAAAGIRDAKIQIDRDYQGHENRINEIIRREAGNIQIEYAGIGHNNNSYAHFASYGAYLGKRKEDMAIKIDRGALKGVGQGIVTHKDRSLVTGDTRGRLGEVYQQVLEMSRGTWKKVYELRPGMQVATIDGWETIIAVKKFAAEQVYDLEIEATHNFVGNGIVAHNTASIALRAGSATLEASNLGTSSTTADIQLYAADSLLASVGDLTLQVSEDSTYPLILRSAQGGIQLSTQSADNGNLTLYSAGTLTLDSSRNNTNIILSPGTGNVGIGTTAPNAKLTVGATLGGAALGTTFITNAGELGGTAGNELALASIGYTVSQPNNVSLGIRALRTSTGVDWTTTAIGLGMDVDATVRAGANIWLHSNGNVGIGTTSPLGKLDIQGDSGILLKAGAAAISLSSGTTSSSDLQLAAADRIDLFAGSLSLQTSSTSAGDLKIMSKGTLALDTSANNTNILMKTGSGNINISTGTLTMTGVLDVRDSTGTLGLAVDSTGNVGIGTTSPGGILDVLGQCVTGDTLLKRRRRRKSRYGDWEEDYWEDVRIDEIEPGDEILTLDEAGGGFVVSKIKALMNKGKKVTFKLTTEDGKTIRTTSEHPYLTRLPNSNKNPFNLDFAFIDEVGVSHSPDQPLFGVGALVINDTIGINRDLHDVLTGALSFYKKNPNKPGRFEFKFNAIKKNNVRFFKAILKILEKYDWNFWYILEDKPFVYEDLPYNYIWERYVAGLTRIAGNFRRPTAVLADYFDEPGSAKSDLKDLRVITAVSNIMQSESHGNLLLQVIDILLGAVNFARKFELSPDLPRHEQKKEISDLVLAILAAKKIRGYKLSSCLSRNNIITGEGPCQEESNLSTQLTTKWVKVKNLKVGREIATLGADDQISWQKIREIEVLKEEQVYDIEVEGTHNFVAGHYVNRLTGQALTGEQEKLYLAWKAAGGSEFPCVTEQASFVSEASGRTSSDPSRGVISVPASTFSGDGLSTDIVSPKVSSATPTADYQSNISSDSLSTNKKATSFEAASLDKGDLNLPRPDNRRYLITDVNSLSSPVSVRRAGDLHSISALAETQGLSSLAPSSGVYPPTKSILTQLKAAGVNPEEVEFGGIVAHNTSSIALRAGSATLEASNLGTSSTTADIQLYATDSMLASVGDLTLQVSEDSTYPLVLRSAQGGIQLSTQSSDNGNLTLYSAGTLTLDSSRNNTNIILSPGTGNVGIGTTSPGAKLDVVNATLAQQLRLQDNQTDATRKYGVLGSGHYTNAEENLALLMGDSGSTASVINIGGGVSSMNAATAIKFYTAANNTTLTGTQVMTIDSSGNVGIGTTGPLGKLDIQGDSGILLKAGAAAISLSSGTTSSSDLQLAAADRIDLFAGSLSLQTSSTSAGDLKIISKGSLILDTSSSLGGTAPIIMNGNVGIGTTNPDQAKLFISGGLFLTLDTSGTTNAGVCWDDSGGSLLYDCDSAPTDLAENFGAADPAITAGDVVAAVEDVGSGEVIHDGTKTTKAFIAKADKPYQSGLVGVVSTQPNQLYGDDGLFSEEERPVPVSLAGRVPVKIDPESPPIKTGDFLTSSDKPGLAMKAAKAGYTIGKALESWSPGGKDKIVMFVNLGTYLGDLLADGSLATQQNFIAGSESDPAFTLDGSNGTYEAYVSNVQGAADLDSLTARVTQLEDLVSLLAGGDTLSGSASALTMDGSNGTYEAYVSNVQNDVNLGSSLVSPLAETKLTLDASTDTVHILGDTAIGGTLTVGLITIDDLDASINSMGEPLRLQNLALADVEIMAGKVIIDKKGNLEVQGEIKAKKVTAEEVETKKLCIEDVCVTRDELKKLLEENESN